MVNFSVVTDSVYDLPKELELMDVTVAEVDVIIDEGNEVRKSSELTSMDIVKLQREGHSVTTSAPNVAEWKRVFESVKEPIVAITVSSKLSSSYNNALVAARLTKKEIYVVDSLSASVGQGLVVYHALLLSERVSASDAAEVLKDIAQRTRVYLSVGSMEFLARSGRVPWAVGKLGEFFGFHPILEVSDGVIKRAGMVRGDPAGKIASFVKDVEEPLIVGKVEPLPEADKLLNILREMGHEVYETYTCPDITVHVGPGSFGVAFLLR